MGSSKRIRLKLRPDLLILSFLGIIALFLLVPSLRGLITGTISLEVQPTKRGAIRYFIYPSSVTQGTPANFFVEFSNIGNLNFTSRIEMHVKDSELNTVESYYDDYVNMTPGDVRNFSATFTANYSGTYWVFVEVPYDGKEEDLNRSFLVTPLFVPPVAPPVVPYAKAKLVNLTMEYPDEVTMTPGQSSLIYVWVMNNGGLDLHKLYFVTSSPEDVSTEVHPSSIPILPMDYSVVFLISVDVPKDTLPSTYPIDFAITSEEMLRRGRVLLKVEPLATKVEIEGLIRTYTALIDRLSGEIEKAKLEGKDVTTAIDYLNAARHELEIAKVYYDYENYETARVHLKTVKEYLEKVVIELARAMYPRRIRLPKLPTLFIASVVGILILIVMVTIYNKRKKKKIERRKAKTKEMMKELKEKVRKK